MTAAWHHLCPGRNWAEREDSLSSERGEGGDQSWEKFFYERGKDFLVRGFRSFEGKGGERNTLFRGKKKIEKSHRW